MSVTQLVVLQGAPGRQAEVLADMATAKRIHTALGARVRAWHVMVAGPASLQFAYVLEFDNMEAFGTFSKRSEASPEWMQFQQTVLGSPAPSATVVAISLASSIAGVDDTAASATGTGPVVRAVRQQVIAQGRDADAIANLKQVKPILEGLGVRFFSRRVVVGGVNTTNRIVTGTEFDDMEAYGRFSDKAAGDQALQEFLATKINIANPALTVASLSLAVELPI